MTDLSKEGDTLGYSAIIPKIDGKILLHNQRIGSVIFKDEKLDKGFCHYLLRDRVYRQHILATCTGSTVKHTSPTKILDFRFALPEKSEQKAIAQILGTLDEKIELNQRMNQTLEDIAKAIFKSWFVDFDPVRAKVEGRPTGLPDEISDLFPDELEESEIGEIPAGWKVSPLDSIGTFKNGLALQKYPPLEGLERLPVVKIAQLRKGSTISDDTYASGVPDGFVIDDGDFVFSWSGTLMAKYWVGGRGALNQHLFKVEGQTQPLWMVAGWVAHFMPEFQSIAASKATTMGHIQREHLRQALCIIPPTDVVDASSAIMTPIVERCILAQQESKVLLELRDTLLPKLISGELRIPDAEKLLAEVGI
jgi:type I restriction enzyme S subunit